MWYWGISAVSDCDSCCRPRVVNPCETCEGSVDSGSVSVGSDLFPGAYVALLWFDDQFTMLEWDATPSAWEGTVSHDGCTYDLSLEITGLQREDAVLTVTDGSATWTFKSNLDIADTLQAINFRFYSRSGTESCSAGDPIQCVCLIPYQTICPTQCVNSTEVVDVSGTDWAECWWVDGAIFTWNAASSQFESGSDTIVISGTGERDVVITIDSVEFTNLAAVDPLCSFDVVSSQGDQLCAIPMNCSTPSNACCDTYERANAVLVAIDNIETSGTDVGDTVDGATELNDIPVPTTPCLYTNNRADVPGDSESAMTDPFLVDTVVTYSCGPSGITFSVIVSITFSLADTRGTEALFQTTFSHAAVVGEDTFVIPFVSGSILVSNTTQIGIASGGQVTLLFSEPFTESP